MISFKDKNVLVVGLGLHGGGVGTVKFLAKEGARLTITDLRSREILMPSLRKLSRFQNIKYTLGEHRLADLARADFILKGPGVKPDSEFMLEAEKRKIPVLNDIAIFFERCPAKIIGITGTRSKSTTAYLVREFLQKKYGRVWLAGNIRKSVLEILPKIKKDDWVVLELSSFQLQDLASSGLKTRGVPHIAIWTNLYPDHLNWHKNIKEYYKAKSGIFVFQNKENYLVINPNDTKVSDITKRAKSRIQAAQPDAELEKVVKKNLGEHYVLPATLAAKAAELAEVKREDVLEILRNFTGLPYRQEKIAEIKGTSFINDTTSTSPEAAIAALNRFWKIKDKNNKIILIAGGQDKNLNYNHMAETISAKAGVLILLPGTATEKLKHKIKLSFLEVKSMSEAVKKAYAQAKPGDYILLSPGAASFGLFKNEFDRGDKFNKYVKKLSK